MDKTTVREETNSMLNYYERTGQVSKAREERQLLAWMNSDEIRTVYRYVCDGHPLHNHLFARRKDIQDWIDECLDDCADCECGGIEEATVSGRYFGDLFMTEA